MVVLRSDLLDLNLLMLLLLLVEEELWRNMLGVVSFDEACLHLFYAGGIIFVNNRRIISSGLQATVISNMLDNRSQPQTLTNCFVKGYDFSMIRRCSNKGLFRRPPRYCSVFPMLKT